MDFVFIEDLRIDTVIGIYDWERRTRQTIALDIEMGFDNANRFSRSWSIRFSRKPRHRTLFGRPACVNIFVILPK